MSNHAEGKKAQKKGALSGHVIQLSIKTLTSKFGK
jgi:hypothetical protein